MMHFANKMIGKKGAGDIIAWVLLIGFSIALATSVFIWMRGQTEDITKSTVNYVEGEMVCQDIAINVRANELCNILTIANKGKFSIESLNIVSYPASGEPISEVKSLATPLKPIQGEIVEFILPQSIKFEVIPIITVNEKTTGCSDKKEVISCTIS
ncbi:MAG: hypothetical protein PHG05_03085 [Candidatus Nanoarchaeia archaeon]|nr:hypothetical protein [Candidatus Nanoarchaeia archaeon]